VATREPAHVVAGEDDVGDSGARDDDVRQGGADQETVLFWKQAQQVQRGQVHRTLARPERHRSGGLACRPQADGEVKCGQDARGPVEQCVP